MIKNTIKKVFNRFGYQLIKSVDMCSKQELEIIEKVNIYTRTSYERMAGLIKAINYIVKNNIDGDFVECGVWRGGSMMAAMYTLIQLDDATRDIYLFDTYEGMPMPTEKDVEFSGKRAADLLKIADKKEGGIDYWCWASIEDVSRNVKTTGYPDYNIHLVEGKVEDTIPSKAPEKIALLRLDTDWYQSTKHELENLYERLVQNGVLIIDDYGHWDGARDAVDEFFEKQSFKPLLNKLDYTGRIIIKV